MGLSFDANGKYIGWSNLFDYTNEETITASENLPMPKQKLYTKSNKGFNIDNYVINITSAKDSTSKIREYAKLLNYLNKYNISDINYTVEGGREVFNNINLHEFTLIPNNLLEEAFKNFVSSHILNVVLNLVNMNLAYKPIEMEDFREASDESPKGEQSSKLTLFNPTTKLIMQYQNITGKNVIGIAANGEKASFMWHYYINDIVKEADYLIDLNSYLYALNLEINTINSNANIKYEYIDVRRYIVDSIYRENISEKYKDTLKQLPTLKEINSNPIITKIKYSLFNFKTSRIFGRSSGKVEEKEINTLPDVNFREIDPNIIQLYGHRLDKSPGDIFVDIMISLVLSAATDSQQQKI